MASGPITSQQIWGNNEKNWETLFFRGSKITADGDCRHEIKRRLFLGRKAMANLDSITNSRDITLLTKVLMVKAVAFAVVMDRCESWTIRKGWALNNWCFWTAVLEDSWESLGRQGYQTSQSSRKLVVSIHWKEWCWSWNSNTLTTWCEEPTHLKNPDAGKDWRQGEKGTIEDEMALTWWTWVWSSFRNCDGQGSLVCCSPWSRKESDITEQVNWTAFISCH